MLNIDRLWVAGAAFLPILATVATLAPLAGLAHTGIGVVVLGVAVSLSRRPRAGAAHHPAATAVGVVAATAGVGLLGAAFALSLAAGDAIFLAILLGSRLIGRYGPRWVALGRAMLLPLTALFLAPPVRAAHDPWLSLAAAAVAGLVAILCSALIPAILPTVRPGPGRGTAMGRPGVQAGRPVWRCGCRRNSIVDTSRLLGGGWCSTVESYLDRWWCGVTLRSAAQRIGAR